MHIPISLVQNFNSNNFDFLDQIWTKRYFRSNTYNIITKFRIFQLVSWCQISALTDNFDFFDQICPRYFPRKTEKVNIAMEFSIFIFKLV